MQLENVLSKPQMNTLNRKIERQIRYKSFQNEQGQTETLPFIFKLAGAGIMDKSVKPPKEMSRDAAFPDVMEIYDPWAKGGPKILILKNITGIEVQLVDDGAGGKKNVDVPKSEKFEFVNGRISVNIDQKYLLAILMFSHHNLSKPASMKMKGKMVPDYLTWTEDDATLYTGVEINKVNDIMLRFKAVEFAKKYSLEQKREVLNLVSQLDKYKHFSPLNKTSEAIENDLFVFANDFPRDFMDANVTEDSRVELLVFDALAKNIITHDSENAKYNLSAYGKVKTIMAYNKVTDLNPEKMLHEFLLDPKNEKVRVEIEKLVKPRAHPYMPDQEVIEAEAAKQAA